MQVEIDLRRLAPPRSQRWWLVATHFPTGVLRCAAGNNLVITHKSARRGAAVACSPRRKPWDELKMHKANLSTSFLQGLCQQRHFGHGLMVMFFHPFVGIFLTLVQIGFFSVALV